MGRALHADCKKGNYSLTKEGPVQFVPKYVYVKPGEGEREIVGHMPCATRLGRHWNAPSCYNSPRDVPTKAPTDQLQTKLAAHNLTHDPADELHVDDFNSAVPQ